MVKLKLFMTLRSPYARKVRIALLEKNINCEEVSVDLAHKPNELLQTNPAGTVPALLTSDGLVFSDSTLILQYLEKEFPTPALCSSDNKKYWDAWNWEELADRLADQGVALFFEKQKADPREAILKKSETVIRQIMSEFQTALADQEYLCGEFSVADIAFGAALDWMQFRLEWNWQDQPEHVRNWLERLHSRKSFQNTIPRLG